MVQPPPLTYADCAAPLCQTKKTILFVYLLWLFLPVTVCVLSLSFFPSWHTPGVSNSSLLLLGSMSSQQDISPKGSEQESHNRFFPLPTTRPCPLTHDPPLSILVGYKLVVAGSRVCYTFFVYCSCICRDLEIGLYVLPCTFCFLWRGLFSDLPLFMPCFFWGLGLVGSWAFLPPTYSVFTLRTC